MTNPNCETTCVVELEANPCSATNQLAYCDACPAADSVAVCQANSRPIACYAQNVSHLNIEHYVRQIWKFIDSKNHTLRWLTRILKEYRMPRKRTYEYSVIKIPFWKNHLKRIWYQRGQKFTVFALKSVIRCLCS